MRHAGTAIVERLDLDVHWPSLIASLSKLPEPVLLESSLHTTPFSRYSILAADPVSSVDLPADGTQPFDWIRHRLSPWFGSVESDPKLPFTGGWIGFLTYEAGLLAEPQLFRFRCDEHLPLARFSLYDTAAVFDHQEECWYGVAVDWKEGGPNRPPASNRLKSVRSFLQSRSPEPGEPDCPPSSSLAQPTIARADFLSRVEEIKAYIRAGDVYQVNLTMGFDVRTDAPPEELYSRLRRISPSGHAALLRWADSAIISSSPELFLNLRDGVVTTRPIKGTRPRTGLAALDVRLRAELERSPKDRAELAMIIDLLRNDLGRVCDYGSVQVEQEGAVETHPTVFHRVATISGRLRGDSDWCDLLAATFPCGSVTGAPKIRAMQIIDELEPTPRGAYCGAIGYIGLDGGMQFNVAIRTLVQHGHSIRSYAGSGIVADSIAEHEYEETMAKARGMLLALNTSVADVAAARHAPHTAIA